MHRGRSTPARGVKIRVPGKSDFISGFRLIGRRGPRGIKFLFLFFRKRVICVHPLPQEGRFAIVTDVGIGMRWT